MAPLRDIECKDCDVVTKDVLVRTENDEVCGSCGSAHIQYAFSLFGGYSIKGNNSASQRPKSAGSFKKKSGSQ